MANNAGVFDPITAPERALLDAVVAAPDDDGPRLVYADWLLSRGPSVHGQLIAVQCELAARAEHDADLDRLRAREAELLADPLLTWLDAYIELNAPRVGMRPSRGFVPTTMFTGHAPRVLGDHLGLERLAPFVTRLRLLDLSWQRVAELGERGVFDRLAILELHDAPWGARVGRAIASGALPRLTELVLSETAFISADIDQLFAVEMPALDRLTLEDCAFDQGAFTRLVERVSPSLRRLRIDKGGIYEVELAKLLRLGLDELRIHDRWLPPILIQQLERAIPQCRIDRVEAPIALG